MYACIDTRLRVNIWNANLNKRDAAKLFRNGNIWHTIMMAWCEYNYNDCFNYVDVINQVLWYNSHIRINNTVLSLPRFIEAGIMNLLRLVL